MAAPAVDSLAALEKSRTACSRLPDEPGEVIGSSKLESQLQKLQSLLDRLSESGISGIYKNIKGLFLAYNRQFSVAVGRTEIIGKTDFHLYPHRLAIKYRKDDALVLKTCQVFETIEKNCKARKPNDYHYVQIYKKPVFDSEGRGIGILCLFWDCENRARAIAALESAGIILPSRLEGPEQRYKYLIDCAQDVIFAFDELGYAVEISSSAETLLGYTREELLRVNLRQLLTEPEFTKVRKLLRRQICSLKTGRAKEPLSRKQDYPLLTVFSKKGDRLVFELNAQVTKLPSGLILVHGIARNVTDRKVSEEKLQEARAKLLEHTQRNACAVIGRFISHQSKTPLGTIRFALKDLKIALKDQISAEVDEIIQDIHEICEEAHHTIERFLEISKGNRFNRKAREVKQLIEQARGMMGQQLREVDYKFTYTETLPRVIVDEFSMCQVFIILFQNSIDAMRGSPERILKVTTRAIAPPFGPPPQIELKITDTGSGFEPGMLRWLKNLGTNQPKSEPSYEERCCGLMIACHLVELNKGTISFENAEKRGATVTILLPTKP